MVRNIVNRIRTRIQIFLLGKGIFFTFGIFDLQRISFSRKTFLRPLPLEDCAIVIQGPIVESSNFTLQSCLFYKRLYPEVNIILSTWDTYSSKTLLEFQKIGIQVVISEDPNNPGPCNVNRQLVSTRAGVEAARQKKYILKIRTDVTFRSPTFLETLLCTLLEQEALGRGARIVVTSFNTFWERPFSINDQIQFGYFSDIQTFWSTSLDSRRTEEFLDISMYNPLVWTDAEVCEVWLVRNYLKKIGVTLPLTVEGGVEAIKNHFIIIDESVLGFYWNKTMMRDIFELNRYQLNSAGTRVEYSDWLRLQM